MVTCLLYTSRRPSRAYSRKTGPCRTLSQTNCVDALPFLPGIGIIEINWSKFIYNKRAVSYTHLSGSPLTLISDPRPTTLTVYSFSINLIFSSKLPKSATACSIRSILILCSNILNLQPGAAKFRSHRHPRHSFSHRSE